MTTANLLPVPKARFFDANGDPLSGGKVYAYDAGTNTPKDTYDDSSGGSANTNPVILDANGEADIWLIGNYKIVLKDSADVQQWSVDDVHGGDLIQNGTESIAGILQLATVAETIAGTNATKATHPLGVKSAAAFNILPVKTALVSADKIAVTDSASSNVNSTILYDDLLTQLSAAISGGGGGGGGGSGGGVLVDTAYVTSSSVAALSGTIPADNTIPQISEGTEILSLSFTPKNTTNALRIRFSGHGAPASLDALTSALFKVGISNALKACIVQTSNNNNNFPQTHYIEHEFVPGSVTPITFKIRVGTSGSGNFYFNGEATANLGGTAGPTLIIEEIDYTAAGGGGGSSNFTINFFGQNGDGSARSDMYFVSPTSGTIDEIDFIDSASYTATTASFEINGTAVTGGNISFTSGGTVYSSNPTANNVLSVGDIVHITLDQTNRSGQFTFIVS